jgi:choline dehydrogenase-like flavoprotein
MNQRGDRATGVEYYDAAGERHVQEAETVVLAAFTVENPRILLNSDSAGGVANSSGLVGRYLLSHAAVMIYGMFPQETNSFFGATGGQLFNQDGYAKDSDEGAYGSRQWEIGLATKPNDLLGIAMSRPDIYGEALHKFMHDGARHLGAMVGVCEDQPNVENRVELSSTKDRYGLPLARTVYEYSADALKLWDISAQEGVAITRAAGATDAWHGPLGGQHIMGGTIMGNDPSKSVVNRYSQAHDVGNLFIGGGGVFPTSSCVNSTFTLHATSLMSAQFMCDNWSAVLA